MRVLICGSCSWEEVDPIKAVMEDAIDTAINERKPITFISGMAAGADDIAYDLAAELGQYCDPFPWNDWGRRKAAVQSFPDKPHAMRNQWMLDSGVDVCYAFAYDLRKSFGTRDMTVRCVRAGVPTFWSDGTIIRRVPIELADTDYKEREYIDISEWEVVG